MNKILQPYRKFRVFIEVVHQSACKKAYGDRGYFLIVFFGMIGDSVLFLNAYNFYKKYCRDNGLKLVLVARKQVIDFYHSIGEAEDTEFIEVNRNLIGNNSAAFKNAVRRISRHYYDYILHVRARISIEDCLIHVIPGNTKVVMRNNTVPPKSIFKRYFYDNTYHQTIYADEQSDQYGRYAKLIKELFDPEFQSEIGKIKISDPRESALSKESVFDMIKKYAVVSAGASEPQKCWPAERFAEVIKMLVKEYSLNVCLVGSSGDSCITNRIMETMQGRYSDYVYDVTGKTTTQEWIELIRNACIVITNDSASVHIAAAVNTPSVCVSPQHDGYRFLPYAPDLVRKEDCLPVPVRCNRLDCFDCQLNNRESEAQNDPLCKKSLRENGVIKCIYDITTEEVCKAVRSILQ